MAQYIPRLPNTKRAILSGLHPSLHRSIKLWDQDRIRDDVLCPVREGEEVSVAEYISNCCKQGTGVENSIGIDMNGGGAGVGANVEDVSGLRDVEVGAISAKGITEDGCNTSDFESLALWDDEAESSPSSTAAASSPAPSDVVADIVEAEVISYI